MPTATLRTDLTSMLGDWRSVLPAAWRPGFDGVELPFDQIPATLAGGPIWPKRFFHLTRTTSARRRFGKSDRWTGGLRRHWFCGVVVHCADRGPRSVRPCRRGVDGTWLAIGGRR